MKIKLYYNDTWKEVNINDSSFRYRALMSDDIVTLNFSLNEALDFPVGTYIEYQGMTYTLTSPERWTRRSKDHLEYSLTFEGPSAELRKYKIRNRSDNRLKFSMTTNPTAFMSLIEGNMNGYGRPGGWSVVNLVNVMENRTLEFNHVSVADALKMIADAFETEFEITSEKVIKLGKVEYFKDSPLALSYGKGNGFKPGTGRVNANDEPPIDVLHVQGGDRNINLGQYGSSVLHLPPGESVTYNGHDYVCSSDGLSMRRQNAPQRTGNEGSLDLSDIYPERYGVVTGVYTVDASTHLYDFEDNTIPYDLDYNDYLLEGETMTVIFQSGMLAGREFSISKYTHSSRRFEIVPQEYEGVVMPGGVFMPESGYSYAVFGCTLPWEYIADAERRMAEEAARYFDENYDYKFTFTGELQGKWAQEKWANVGGYLKVGGYIRFTDTDFAPDGVDIRITGIKDFLYSPYTPLIEISNSVAAGGIGTALRQISRQDVRIDDSYNRAVNYTRRRFRDVEETTSALVDAKLSGFSAQIDPIAIRTMQLIAGDESLQFRFVDSKTNPVEVPCPVRYSIFYGALEWEAGIVEHFTIGITDISSSHENDIHRFWSFSSGASGSLTGSLAGTMYYIYIRCSKDSESATIIVSADAVGFEDEVGYYHLLVGLLNSEREGTRSFATVYGFTEILPGRITTDSIVSADGSSFFNLASNSFNLGNRLSFNEDGNNTLRLSGAFVQSGNGDYSPLGSYCGTYNSERVYKAGDEVSYQGEDGTVSTYRCIILEGTIVGVPPTDSTKWQVLARGVEGPQGEPGRDGQDGEPGAPGTPGTPGVSPIVSARKDTDGVYYWTVNGEWMLDDNGNKIRAIGYDGEDGEPGTPGTPGVTPRFEIRDDGYWWVSYDNGETWTRLGKAQGEDGLDGRWGPALIFRGEWKPDAVYKGDYDTIDVVKYGSEYFMALPTAGFFYGQLPAEGSAYWKPFGASFESVATGLLLAEESYINNLMVRDLRTYERNNLYLQISSSENAFKAVDSAGNVRLRIDGATQLMSAYDTEGNEVVQIGGGLVASNPATMHSPESIESGEWTSVYLGPDYDMAFNEDAVSQSPELREECLNIPDDEFGLGKLVTLSYDPSVSYGNLGYRRTTAKASLVIPEAGTIQIPGFSTMQTEPHPVYDSGGPGVNNSDVLYAEHLVFRIMTESKTVLYSKTVWHFLDNNYLSYGYVPNADLALGYGIDIADLELQVSSGGGITLECEYEAFTLSAWLKIEKEVTPPTIPTNYVGYYDYILEILNYTATTVTFSPSLAMTKLGTNGFFSMWTPRQYLYYNQNYGFEVRAGNNMFRIRSEGISLSFDGSRWYTLSRDSNGYAKLQ